MPRDRPGDEPAVTHESPDSPFHVRGTDHVTVEGSDADATVAFYRDLLGMSLVLRQPNLDRPELEHLFFDTGDGRLLTFFVSDDREADPSPVDSGPGEVHHLAFRVSPEELAEVKAGLDDAGHDYTEFDRGPFHSIYTHDHDGLGVELVVEKYDLPDDRRGEALALAQAKRVADGAEFVEDEHMQAALADLGLDPEPSAVDEAPTGRGVD